MFDQLMKVSKGFKLVFIGLIIMLCSMVGLVFVAGANLGGVPEVASVVLLIGVITSLIGKFFCLAVPEQAGAARAMIFISVGLELLGLAGQVFLEIDILARLNIIPANQRTEFAGGAALLLLAAPIFFLFFTRSVAHFVHRPDLGRKSMSVLTLWVTGFFCTLIGVVALVAAVFGFCMAFRGGGQQLGAAMGVVFCVGVIVIIAALVFWLIALIQFSMLLHGMSLATAKHARRLTQGRNDEDDYEYDEEEDDKQRPRGRSRRYDDDDYDDYDDDVDDRPRR